MRQYIDFIEDEQCQRILPSQKSKQKEEMKKDLMKLIPGGYRI
jgi:hypothetical protein